MARSKYENPSAPERPERETLFLAMRQRPAEPSTIARIATLSDPFKFGHASTTRSSNRKSGDESGDHHSSNPLMFNGEAVGSIPTAGAFLNQRAASGNRQSKSLTERFFSGIACAMVPENPPDIPIR